MATSAMLGHYLKAYDQAHQAMYDALHDLHVLRCETHCDRQRPAERTKALNAKLFRLGRYAQRNVYAETNTLAADILTMKGI